MFSTKLSDYVIAQDITNHLQVKVGDVVTISEMGYTQLCREKAFWRNVAIGGTLTALTFGTCTAFAGIGVVGSELAIGVTATEIAAAGGLLGGTATACGQKLWNDNLISRQTLGTVGFLGKVVAIDKKFFSELYHVQVEFYMPDGTTKTEWVDAHHLLKLMTKFEDAERTAEIQRKAAEAQRKYDAKLKDEHRAQFAPENVSLMQELQDAKSQRNLIAGLAPFALLLLLI